jgi:hypothetical protein
MRRENINLTLSIVCAVASVLGAFFTASIALGYNEGWKTRHANSRKKPL